MEKRHSDSGVRNTGATTAITYTPKILRNLAEICEEMGVSAKVVRRWVRDGAPIAVDKSANRIRYSAEAARLQFWRENEGNAR